MKSKLLSLLVCFGLLLAIVALASWVGKRLEKPFHKNSVSSNSLIFGETGKILRTLKLIQPVENTDIGKDYYPNPIEIVERAVADRKKWLLIDRYQKYREKIYCYIELDSELDRNHFSLLIKKNGEWEGEGAITILKNLMFAPPFIDHNGANIPIKLAFFNTFSSVKIKSVVFLQDGFRPLIFADEIALKKLFPNRAQAKRTVVDGGIVLAQSDTPAFYGSTLHFKRKWMVGVSKYQKKQGESKIDYTSTRNHPLRDNLSLSDNNLSNMSKTTVPILAIDMTEKDLYSDESGILKNSGGKGRDWERVSLVRLYRDGKEVINSFTGIRLQGGKPGRKMGLINFRLYFKDIYGIQQVDSKDLFDRDIGAIKRLAVKQSQWENWPLNSPIAYDIAHQLGALAPPTDLVQLYLNGKHLGQYYLVPHPGETQVKLNLPKANYFFYRDRSEPHHADYAFIVEHLLKKFKNEEPLTEAYARQFFDLDNLEGQLFAFIFCGTTDYCQGLTLKTDTPGSRIFWYTWDMDHSFIDVPTEIHHEKLNRERWEQTPNIDSFFSIVKGQELSGELCSRVDLFIDLILEDPEYREKVLSRILNAFNHKLTDEFLAELLNKHWEKLYRAGNEYTYDYMARLSEFFAQRKSFLTKQMEKYLGPKSLTTCIVSSNTYPISIEGFEKLGPYVGTHRTGMPLRIDLPASEAGGLWQVNGVPAEQSKVIFIVPPAESECRVQLVAGK